ncbi:phosphatase [Collinsella sp. AGMB00827]|uniref:Phosphatase n=1 Tax=Collinsella ureilytica TaxID=2869515 RepID=A0ABS7MKE3_9ACTN|nr:phosphatase [Collinsella urealyticum]MBY4797838.1 phosphatase [Collinsella urealyticum]
MLQILGDMHTHTLYSRHAYSTLQENVTAASERGLEILGSTDHFSPMIHAGHDLRDFQFFVNQGIWPRTWMGVTLLRGCEADIVSLAGELYGEDILISENIVGNPYREARSLFDHITSDLDYVIASVHNRAFSEGASVAEGTEMYLKVLDHPRVLVLGHTGRSGVAYDIDTVLAYAKEKHKLIEINEHSLKMNGGSEPYATCRKIAERCAELSVGICVNTDAHISTRIGEMPAALDMLEEIDFPQELIANRGKQAFLEALAASGVCPDKKFLATHV